MVEATHNTDQCEVALLDREDRPAWRVACFNYRSQAELEAMGITFPAPATPRSTPSSSRAPPSTPGKASQAAPSQLPTPEPTPKVRRVDVLRTSRHLAPSPASADAIRGFASTRSPPPHRPSRRPSASSLRPVAK